MKKAIALVSGILLCLIPLLSLNSCANQYDKSTETPVGNETITLATTTTTDKSSNEQQSPVVYIRMEDDERYQEEYQRMAKGPSDVSNHGESWESKDFDVSHDATYDLIYADVGVTFDIPLSTYYTLGYHIKDFEVDVTFADGEEDIVEVVGIDKYKALDGGDGNPGLQVKTLNSGVAHAYVKSTYKPAGDNSIHQVIVIVQE